MPRQVQSFIIANIEREDAFLRHLTCASQQNRSKCAFGTLARRIPGLSYEKSPEDHLRPWTDLSSLSSQYQIRLMARFGRKQLRKVQTDHKDDTDFGPPRVEGSKVHADSEGSQSVSKATQEKKSPTHFPSSHYCSIPLPQTIA